MRNDALPDVPLGCGPEGAVSKYADLINTLEGMAGSYAYAIRKGVLREAGRTIVGLEGVLRSLEDSYRVRGDKIADLQVELDAARQAISDGDAERERLKEDLSAARQSLYEVAAQRNELHAILEKHSINAEQQ